MKPSRYPNSWHLKEIFTYAIVYGVYLAASTIVFFTVAVQTTFFQEKFGVEYFQYKSQSHAYLGWNQPMLNSIIYLQVSTISQALIFITRSHGFFFLERPSLVLVGAFALAQLIATFIAVWADWSFTHIQGCGWRWAAIVWVWNIIWFFPMDLLKVNLNAILQPTLSLFIFSSPFALASTNDESAPSKSLSPVDPRPRTNVSTGK